MLASKLYSPTLREIPSDAEIASHQYMLKAGMIRKNGNGLYSFLPLGRRVELKIEAIVREEMDKTGAQEIMMPIVQPAEIWHESGRWDAYGPEMFKLTDRHDNKYCLGPTLMKNRLRRSSVMNCVPISSCRLRSGRCRINTATKSVPVWASCAAVNLS